MVDITDRSSSDTILQPIADCEGTGHREGDCTLCESSGPGTLEDIFRRDAEPAIVVAFTVDDVRSSLGRPRRRD